MNILKIFLSLFKEFLTFIDIIKIYFQLILNEIFIILQNTT
jgi:hypothetical protein